MVGILLNLLMYSLIFNQFMFIISLYLPGTDSTDHVRNDINADSKMQQCDCCYCEVFGHGMVK